MNNRKELEESIGVGMGNCQSKQGRMIRLMARFREHKKLAQNEPSFPRQLTIPSVSYLLRRGAMGNNILRSGPGTIVHTSPPSEYA